LKKKTITLNLAILTNTILQLSSTLFQFYDQKSSTICLSNVKFKSLLSCTQW